MGFVGRERETKPHLWNCNLIDCCPHYPVEFLKLLRAWARKSERRRESGGKKKVGGRKKKGEKDMELMELSGAKPLKSPATQQLRRVGRAGGKEWKRNPKDPHPKKRSLWCIFSPFALSTLKFSRKPPLCTVMKLDYEAANAFSAADKKVRLFIFRESLWRFPCFPTPGLKGVDWRGGKSWPWDSRPRLRWRIRLPSDSWGFHLRCCLKELLISPCFSPRPSWFLDERAVA